MVDSGTTPMHHLTIVVSSTAGGGALASGNRRRLITCQHLQKFLGDAPT
jgi:hypothetical protein